MERTSLFARSLGETSDVVSKEMFAFTTRGQEDVCLRPENTAGGETFDSPSTPFSLFLPWY